MSEEKTKEFKEEETLSRKFIPVEESDIIFVLKDYLGKTIGEQYLYSFIDSELSLETGATQKRIDRVAQELGCVNEGSASFLKLVKKPNRPTIRRGRDLYGG